MSDPTSNAAQGRDGRKDHQRQTGNDPQGPTGMARGTYVPLAARVRGYKDRPWLQRRVRLRNRVGRRLIRWGKTLQDDANGRVRQVTDEFVRARDASRWPEPTEKRTKGHRG